jgi:hypothetical protein
MLSVDEFAILVGSTITQQALQQLTVREPQSLGEAAIALFWLREHSEKSVKFINSGGICTASVNAWGVRLWLLFKKGS